MVAGVAVMLVATKEILHCSHDKISALSTLLLHLQYNYLPPSKKRKEKGDL
jgi:hypothetical protein